MGNYIKDIIDKAKRKKQNGMSDIDIARFVHVELGKVIYYDNNYTEKRLEEKTKTELSKKRQSNMLIADIDKSSIKQICKGMAEIYAEILNEIGIEARAIAVKAKGETTEVDQNEAEHYCTVLKIGEQEYVQDYLIESALARIKIGEAEIAENMPGICPIEEYKERGAKGLKETELSHRYLEDTFGDDIKDLSDTTVFETIFEKLNQYFKDTETNFGFEEAKDFTFLAVNGLLQPEKGKVGFINLVRESKTECGVACIYEIEGKKYLVRGEDQSTDIDIPAGEISDDDFKKILEQGYEGRTQKERNQIETRYFKSEKDIQEFGEETISEQQDTANKDAVEQTIEEQERVARDAKDNAQSLQEMKNYYCNNR